MSSVMKIAIIGAGVVGTATAFRLQEQFGNSVSITIFSDEFSPHTTGDVSAGLWGPFLLSDTPPEKILYIITLKIGFQQRNSIHIVFSVVENGQKTRTISSINCGKMVTPLKPEFLCCQSCE